MAEIIAVISSPPFLDARADTTASIKGQNAPTAHDPEAFGTTPGQLGAMKAGPMETTMTEPTIVPTLDWHGCYDDGWKGLLIPAAFAHPAKMARGLLCRILDFGLERGYWRKGDVLLDPFSGIGTTAIEGASRGLKVIGCELEEKFHKLALENLELHRRKWEKFGDPFPVLLQGDSRRLGEVLREAGVTAAISSPPYIDTHMDFSANTLKNANCGVNKGTYGGCCKCCGEDIPEFLTVDHVNGDGAAHRKACGKGRKIYADLKQRGFPQDGFRLLCFNCNIALGFYGYCPHHPETKRAVDHRPRNPGRKRIVV